MNRPQFFRILILAFAVMINTGCSIKDSFLNSALKSTQAINLTTVGENHIVGAGQVLVSGFCAYGSTIEITYGSGFDAGSPTTATCGSCSSSENPNCGGFFSSTGKYSFIATLSGTTGSRQVTLVSKDSDGAEISSLTRNFTYEPISQTAYAKPLFSSGEVNFGNAVDIDGDTIVVGSVFDPNNSKTIDHGSTYTPGTLASAGAGAAYVFRKVSGSWVQEAYLKGIYSQGSENFGISVAISGDTIAVGAYGDDHSQNTIFNAGMTAPAEDATAVSAGSVYIFKRTGSTWAFESYIKAPNAGANDVFGFAVDISGDYLVVGAYGEDSGLPGVQNGSITDDNSKANTGAAYVFKRTSGAWAFQSYLKAPEIDDTDRFGYAVSISGDVIAVGAYGEDSNVTGVTMGTGASTDNSQPSTGAVYIFRRSGTNWAQEAFIKGHSINSSDVFGFSIALSGNTLVVGAYGEDSNITGVLNGTSGSTNNGIAASGAAYVFFYNTGTSTWAQQAYLKGSDTDISDQFGYRVAIDADTIVVGAYTEDSNATGVSNGTSGSSNDSTSAAGAAYVFVRSGVNWSQQAYLKPAVTGVDYNFGASVAVSGDTIIVGEPNDRSDTSGVTMGTSASADYSGNYLGAGYVFVRTTTSWSQDAYLKPYVKSSYTTYGNAIDLDGDTAVIGVKGDFLPGNTITNGPTVSNVSTAISGSSGAAYVLRKVSGNWVQEAFLKAPNAEAGDTFGETVAISGDTVIVGSIREDNGTVGVQNGTLTTDNNSTSNVGAVYVFHRTGSSWSFQSYLKPAVAQAALVFGRTLDIDGDTIVVGASGDASDVGGVVNGTTGGPVNSNMTAAGALFVFKRTGTNWAQESYIKPAVPMAAQNFSFHNVQISGDVIVTSSLYESSNSTGVTMGTSGGSTDTSAANSGAAWVFRRTGSSWAQEAFIKAPIATAEDSFGRVSINGNDLVIGAHGDSTDFKGVQNTETPSTSSKTFQSGAVYIYRYESAAWVLKSFLKPPNIAEDMGFGMLSAVQNDTLFIGSWRESNSNSSVLHASQLSATDTAGSTNSGAVYVYRRLNDAWYFSDYIKPPNNAAESMFGIRLAVSDHTLMIGAYAEGGGSQGVTNGAPPSATPNYYSGAVYFYNLDF